MVENSPGTGSNRQSLLGKLTLAVVLFVATASTPAAAEVGGWLHFVGGEAHGYVQVPHHP